MFSMTSVNRLKKGGRYVESSHSWNRVKKVYMRLQHDKCAYCERQLASEDFGGAIEHDLGWPIGNIIVVAIGNEQ